ncbi:MAG: hypothetical protein WKG00_03190 [Polyangiaceae bacterium]
MLLALGRYPGILLARNEVGQGYTGDLLFALQKALRPFGRPAMEAAVAATQRHRIVYGLGVGSPDLVGAVEGRAFGLELKTEVGVVSDVQSRWHSAASRRGLHVEVVRRVEDALAAVDRCRAGGRR